MPNHRLVGVALGLVVGAGMGLVDVGAAPEDGMPENLLLEARVEASSEYSDQYRALFVADGKVPPEGSQAADLGAAWCVRKEISGDRGELRITWETPVRPAEIVYYGRTAWFVEECWKDYEVYLDESERPAASGSFRMRHGPQRIALPGSPVRRIVLRFLSSYGGPNPGASEIQVFAERASDRVLRRFLARQGSLGSMPWVESSEPEALRALVGDLRRLHGESAADWDELLRRLDAAAKGNDLEEMEALERDVLLFDVDRLLVIQRHEINASHVYTYHYEGFRPGGGLYVVSARDGGAERRLLVESPEGQILDCDLSYDGELALFSWRRRESEGYHLWTVKVDGSELRRLTDGEWHDYNACWLPDGGIAFLSTRSPQFAYCWHAPVGILHRMGADGSEVRSLSANYLNDFTPQVLDDGRIIYTRWEYVDRPAIPIQSLWTVNPDGTGLAGYFGNRVLSPGTFMEARPIPGTTRVVCTMTGHNGPTRGAIGVVDRALGVNAQEAIENITPDVPVPKVEEGNGNTGGSKLYSGPYPLDRVRLLVSARGPVLARTFRGDCQTVVLPEPPADMQYFCPQPIRPRSRPRVIPSAHVDPTAEYATVYLQDVYLGLEPEVRRGEVRAIRVVRELEKTVRIDPSLRAFGFQFPVISCGATYAGKEVLGDVPVGDDGSAYFYVPADIPVYFMALDAKGRAVQRMRSFTHFKKGEVQGCIGCHENRAETPRTASRVAFRGEPVHLTPPEWGRGGFDYSRIVQPVLDEHCVGCHRPVEPAGGVDLTGDKTDYFNVSYDVLARQSQGPKGSPYISWIPTYNGQEQNILDVTPGTWGSPRSRLAEVVLSGHPDREGRKQVEMDEAGRRRILAWIDLNVPYYGSSETAYPHATGCRRIVPAELEKVLADVAARRCASCHEGGKIPRREWIRITSPEHNDFLVAPLAVEAGGSGRCGAAIFETRDDPDYRAILETFAPVTDQLARVPRMDMPGARPSTEVSRCCQ